MKCLRNKETNLYRALSGRFFIGKAELVSCFIEKKELISCFIRKTNTGLMERQ